MKRDAQATRARIRAAATAEFAAYGIAGARVDRIAATAGANKNMIYIYFGSKEQLFDAVFSEAIGELLDTVPIDAADLPRYAGELYDHMELHPELSRLARWHGLERPGGLSTVESVLTSTGAKIAAIARAQDDGLVSTRLSADQLVGMLLAIAATWSAGAPELAGGSPPPEVVASRRAAVVWAVDRLITP